ncbi:GTA baseplate fiber-binding domain-containing protein [Brucella intermedia]|uniref:GTA baseplate fiber-binding domain-containing protein n=1 Tax=Brucella intermedia TaxID=94625 RepID=UPI003F656DB9
MVWGRLLRAPNGEGKVLQFLDEEEIGLNRWKLTRALRGQFGTERAASLLKNTPFIWLDGAFVAAGLQASEVGFELNWRVGTIIN